jgi:hypothetical protein
MHPPPIRMAEESVQGLRMLRLPALNSVFVPLPVTDADHLRTANQMLLSECLSGSFW